MMRDRREFWISGCEIEKRDWLVRDGNRVVKPPACNGHSAYMSPNSAGKTTPTFGVWVSCCLNGRGCPSGQDERRNADFEKRTARQTEVLPGTKNRPAMFKKNRDAFKNQDLQIDLKWQEF